MNVSIRRDVEYAITRDRREDVLVHVPPHRRPTLLCTVLLCALKPTKLETRLSQTCNIYKPLPFVAVVGPPASWVLGRGTVFLFMCAVL